MVRAPEWQATFGFDYELPMGRNMKLVLANSNRSATRYLTSLSRRSDFYFPSYLKSDLSATIKGPDDRWEFSVIGKNIQNKLTTGNCLGFNAANGAFFWWTGDRRNGPRPGWNRRDRMLCGPRPGNLASSDLPAIRLSGPRT
jgi:iron complex outermembrane recepter protein